MHLRPSRPSRPSRFFGTPRRQRGTTLLEALIAFLVLSFGMLGMARVQTHLRTGADVARQRSEAVQFAQEDIESLRAFAVLAVAPGGSPSEASFEASFEAIANTSRTVGAGSGAASGAVTGDATNTSYSVVRVVDTVAALHAKAVRVTVAWTDRTGDAQHVALATVIAGTAPAFSGALGLARSAVHVKGPLGRSVRIPLGATNLGDGRSVFGPVGGGSVAFVFDNASGSVIGSCQGVPPGVVPSVPQSAAASGPTAGALGVCDTNVGRLLSGVVRFSSTSPPDAARGRDVPLTLSVDIAAGSVATRNVAPVGAAVVPVCSVEPIATADGDRYLAYHCAVYALNDDDAPPRITLLPIGWTIGNGAADHRVCRYTADTGRAHQNFLVIAGTENCPVGRATPVVGKAIGNFAGNVTGNNGDVYADLSTAPYAP